MSSIVCRKLDIIHSLPYPPDGEDRLVNRSRASSIAHAVRSRILRGGEDRLWTYADFARLDRIAVAAALSRLARAGDITRVRRGVYYRPKPTRFGASRPDPEALVDAVLRQRGAAALPSGPGEYNRLGLTTQVAGVVTRATGGRVPRAPMAGVAVQAAERPLERQRGIRPAERTALDALRDVTRIPGASAGEVLRRLKTLLRSRQLDFARLARFARAEPPRVRALLGALGTDVRADGAARAVRASALAELRAGLNPLTAYRLPGVDRVLRHATAWRIK